MIVKLRDGFHSSEFEPILLILNEDEKKTIAAMQPTERMMAIYPKNGGFTPELVQQWMYDGLETIQQPQPQIVNELPPPVAIPAPKETTSGPN